MIALQKYVQGTWEICKGYLYKDLQLIEQTLNQIQNNVTTNAATAAVAPGVVTIATKPGDTSRASLSAVAPDPNLFIDVNTGETWLLEAFLFVKASSLTPDFKVGIIGPTGMSVQFGWDAGVAASQPQFAAVAPATTPTAIASGSGTITAGLAVGIIGLRLTAVCGIGSIGGTVSIAWAQATSDASPVVVKAASVLRGTRIA